MQKDDDLFEQEGMHRFSQPTGYIDWQQTAKITMETHIPESNLGYKMMEKMGWKAGRGLGSHGQGNSCLYTKRLFCSSFFFRKSGSYIN